MNLQGKINVIKEAKDNIKAAIIAKGVTPSGNISTYATAIGEIDTTNNQTKTVTTNGVVRYDEGYTGLESVTVNVNQAVENKNIVANGTYTPSSGYIGFGTVTVDVPFITENITVEPMITTQIIDTTVDGIAKVTVEAVTASIDEDIIASNIRNGIEILGVMGNLIELKGQTKTFNVQNSGITTITPDAGYNGITSIQITPNLETKTITQNGTYSPGNSYCGFDEITVDVDLNLQSKTITQNGTYTPDSGYTGFDEVTVNVNLALQDRTFTANGTYSPESGYNGIEHVTVNVQPTLQNKTVTVNGSYTADSGYDGLGTVTVNTQSVNNTTLSATQNGTYTPSSNYTGYSSVTVNVPQSTITGDGIPRVVENGVYGLPSTSFSFSFPSNAASLANDSFRFAFYNCNTLTSVDFANITQIGKRALYYAFYDCSALISIDLSNITTIGEEGLSYAFSNCRNLVGNIDLSGITTISDRCLTQTFNSCKKITSVDLSGLISITGSGSNFGLSSTFIYCSALTSVDLSNLEKITSDRAMQRAFASCTSLQTLLFPSLTSTFNVPSSGTTYTNQFDYMLNGVTGCTVHFPSNLQSVIGSWSDVTNGFGGTNTTVLFDLPATT